MSYLAVDKPTLRKDLKLAVAEISYANDDGAGRKALITLMPHYIPEYDRGRINEIVNQEARPDVIKVWDVVNNAWRLVPLSRVLYCQMKDGY